MPVLSKDSKEYKYDGKYEYIYIMGQGCTMTKAKINALKEALVDTGIGTMISLPLNFFLASLAIQLAWSATEITFYFTAFFFVIAVVRKVYIRLYFAGKQSDENKNNT